MKGNDLKSTRRSGREDQVTERAAEAGTSGCGGDETGLEQTAAFAPRGTASATDREPRQLGRYEIVRQLGSGSFGAVYEAYDGQLNRAVAIKVPFHRDADTFRHEAQIVAGLHHPGIVTAYDFGVTDDGRCYLVCELVTGESMLDQLEREAVSIAEAVRIASCCAAALHYAHKRGIVHRDIKPSNVLLDGDGNPRIADFGMALHEDEEHEQRDEISGSPAYMAPEQLRGESQYVDGRSDIWSLGVMLYELLAGRRPFSGKTRGRLFDEILHRTPKPIRLSQEEVPADLEDIVLRCLAKDPCDRFRTAADVQERLERYRSAAATASQGKASSASPSAKRASPFGWERMAWIGTGLLIVAGLITIGWLMLGPGVSDTSTRPTADSRIPAVIPETPEVDFRVVVWNPAQPTRQGVSVTRPEVLPLRPGEEVVVEATASRDCYFYLVWLGSDSGVTPLHPWPVGDWSARPNAESATQRLRLAIGTVNPTPATETALLLVRSDPLPLDVDLPSLLSGFPQPDLLVL